MALWRAWDAPAFLSSPDRQWTTRVFVGCWGVIHARPGLSVGATFIVGPELVLLWLARNQQAAGSSIHARNPIVLREQVEKEQDCWLV